MLKPNVQIKMYPYNYQNLLKLVLDLLSVVNRNTGSYIIIFPFKKAKSLFFKKKSWCLFFTMITLQWPITA